PVVWIPEFDKDSGLYSWGLSDILFTTFYTPPSEGLVWGVGAAFEIPTGGSKRGSQKWNIGPSAVVLYQPGNWTVGALANNLWSFAGKSEREDVNKGLINVFLAYQLGDGWYLNSAPIITVDWKADSGQKWIVPLGAGGGKVTMVGKLPINAQVGAYANVVKPDFGPDWQLRVQVQFFLPKPGSAEG
ncbi:MAG: neuromedin U, partial [bacterium]